VLFGPLRPHASRIALLLDPVLDGTLNAEAAVAYATLFNRNIQADFIHPDEVAAGLSARYDVVYAAGASALTDAVTGALRAFVLNGGVVVADHRRGSPNVSAGSARRVDDLFAAGVSPRQGTGAGGRDAASSVPRASARGAFPVRVTNHGTGRVFLIPPSQAAARPHGTEPRESADATLERVFSAAGLKPEVAIEGAGGLVDARFLESADAMLLVAINYGSSPRRVTFTFAPDVPEAIWQNMETGAAVNFVQGTDGPTYAHTFGGQDVIVLVRGKRLR
jgi:hypothetical protein